MASRRKNAYARKMKSAAGMAMSKKKRPKKKRMSEMSHAEKYEYLDKMAGDDVVP